MTRNLLIVVVGFIVLLCSTLLVRAGLDGEARAATVESMGAAQPVETLAYQVRAGDTLYRISELYYGSPSHWQVIADANHITTPNALRAGQTLRIPVGSAAPTIAQAPLPTPVANVSKNEPLAMLDWSPSPDIFPDGLTAIVHREGESCAIRMITGISDGPNILMSDVFAAAEGQFRFMFATDISEDGAQSLTTVWQVGADNYFTRIYRQGRNGAPCVCEEVPADPRAVLFEREMTE